MRAIGTIPTEPDARRFIDHLLTLKVAARAEAGSQGFTIWVFDENQLAQSRQELTEFLANPNDPRYQTAAETAQAVRDEREREEKHYRKNFIDFRSRWARADPRRAPVTMALIAASVVVAFVSRFGDADQPLTGLMAIATYHEEGASLDEIHHGEVWRLVTPIFLHFGALHIFFNMWWLHDLGGLIENRRGTWRLALLVLTTAIVSNLAQFYWSGPTFGGMSGVVCGLFGYVWMKSRYDAGSGLYLDRGTVTFMLVYLALCVLGFVGHIANAAHLIGLLVGVVIGAAPHFWRKLLRR